MRNLTEKDGELLEDAEELLEKAEELLEKADELIDKVVRGTRWDRSTKEGSKHFREALDVDRLKKP
tara:strand:+ start:148 stop:345 length:198 start_codon:yes stop_codon:yes gene_type:complete